MKLIFPAVVIFLGSLLYATRMIPDVVSVTVIGAGSALMVLAWVLHTDDSLHSSDRCDCCDKRWVRIMSSQNCPYCVEWFRGYYCLRCFDEVEAEMRKQYFAEEERHA